MIEPGQVHVTTHRVADGVTIAQVLADCRRVSAGLARIGDKWTVLVIVVLQRGPQRFNGLRRSIDGISQQMLSRTLRQLERDGMVVRTIVPSTPPQVSYDLTELGWSLSGPLLAVGQWVYENIEAIDAARTEYDQRAES